MKRLCLRATAAIVCWLPFFTGCSRVATKTTTEAPPAPPIELKWTEDYQAALAQAKAENKLVLLNFTGSTWCPPCIALEANVFRTKAFQEYAEKNLVLLKVDFPNPSSLPPKAEELANQYLGGNLLFPSLVIASADGKRLGSTGYAGTGPEALIGDLRKISQR